MQLFEPLRRAAAKLKAGVAVYTPITPEQSFDRALIAGRVIAGMFGIFALVAVLLAMLGLYGVVSLVVSQRLQEFGIRMALGAQAREITQMVLRQGVFQLALGVTIGIAVTLALLQAGGSGFRSLLFRVSPHDPTVFGGVVAILTLATLVACLLPARMAAKVDPIIALRAEQTRS